MPDVNFSNPVTIGGTRYLAIGDSYAAGQGVKPYETDSGDDPGDDRCHRSLKGYARLLTFTSDVRTDNRACIGAVIDNMSTTVQLHNGAPNKFGLQLSETFKPSWRGDDVGLVTVSIGGNDAGFADVLGFCAGRSACVAKPFKEGLTLREWAAAKIPLIAEHARLIYRTIKEGNPKARILVLGYPHLFPEGRLTSGACDLIASRYGTDERNFVRTEASELNAALENVAVAEGLEFIHTKWMFANHEECAPGGAWVNSFKVSDFGASFHPTKRGQRAYARLISCYLQLHPGTQAAQTEDRLPGLKGSSAGGLGDEDLLACARGTVV